MSDFAAIIDRAIQTDSDAQEAIKIARLNSSGTIWMIGGFLFRTLAAHLYGSTKQVTDFDFIIEKINENLIIPDGWTKTLTSLGQPRLIYKSERQIDLVVLTGVNSIVRYGSSPTIQNFLTGVPLTIQSLAYNLGTKELVGDVGINSLLTKHISVNNAKELHSYAPKRGQTPEQYMASKAQSLGFTYKLA